MSLHRILSSVQRRSYLAYHCQSQWNMVWNTSNYDRNERGIYFVDGSQNHSVVQNPFTISESSWFEYGLVISDEDDFNMLYSLTLNQQLTPDPSQSNSRICVYLIGAERASHPRILPVSFNGNTTCLWQSVEGRGENFWVL